MNRTASAHYIASARPLPDTHRRRWERPALPHVQLEARVVLEPARELRCAAIRKCAVRMKGAKSRVRVCDRGQTLNVANVASAAWAGSGFFKWLQQWARRI